MGPIDAPTLDAAARAADTVAKPSVLAMVVAILGLGGCALLVWRDEVRADAQIQVMQRMADEIGMLRGDFQAAGIRVSRRPASSPTRETAE